MRRLRVVAALAAVLVLSACAGIPTSGPVQQGQSVAADVSNQFIRVIARPPHDGMTPEELVSGFRDATASPEPGFTTARQYLTDSASATWDPASGVRITDAHGLTLTRRGGLVAGEGGQTGAIDAMGEYQVALAGSRLTVSYGVTQVDGQWRISSLPAGLVLGQSDIDRAYRTFDLYYFTRDFATLVPAPVTLPVTGSGIATQLVRELLSGPTSWLAPAVTTAFPEGTKLALDAVPVTEGIADVAFTSELLSADPTTRQKLSAQLVWTLRQLPEISGVRITVNGQAVPVQGTTVPQPVTAWPSVDPAALSSTATAYAVDKRGLVALTPDGAELAAKVKPDIVAPGISLDSSRVAGLSEDRRSLWEGAISADSSLTKLYSGTDLSRPSWDSSGTIWVVDRGSGLVAIRDDASKPVPVPVAGLPSGVSDKSLLAVSVSRDGTRLALLVRRGAHVEPLVARVVRFGATLSVSAPRRIENVVTDAVDLAWLDADTLAVLGSAGAASLEVLALPLGYTPIRHTLAPEGAVSLAAAPARQLVVGAAAAILRSSGSTWDRVAEGTFPVYPG